MAVSATNKARWVQNNLVYDKSTGIAASAIQN